MMFTKHPATRAEGWGTATGCLPSKNLALGLPPMLQNHTSCGRGLGKVAWRVILRCRDRKEREARRMY